MFSFQQFPERQDYQQRLSYPLNEEKMIESYRNEDYLTHTVVVSFSKLSEFSQPS